MDVLPPHALSPPRPHRRRRLLLVLALGAHLVVALFLAVDGVDRARGLGDGAPFDPSALLFVPVAGWSAVLALLATLLPGRWPRWFALVLGAVGLVLALVLVPIYGLGLLLLPGAALAFSAGVLDD